MLEWERPQEKERGPGFFGRILRKVDGCDVRFIFDGKMEDNMITIDDFYENTTEKMHLFLHSETIKGRIILLPKTAYHHSGILIELIGIISIRNKEHKIDFMRQEKRFESDSIQIPISLEFQFSAPKEYESYRGFNVHVSYFIRVTIYRPVKNIIEMEEIWISKIDEKNNQLQLNFPSSSLPSHYYYNFFREVNFGPESISMDVGVENILHIEFKYDKKIFHLYERILGKVTFKIVDMDIKHGEICFMRKEIITSCNNNNNNNKSKDLVHSETLQKFEIMDGTPIVGEIVPIRLYLRSIPHLTPTYNNIHNSFRVLYYLNLVLVTSEGRRYFKQHEIILYRKHGQEMPMGTMSELS